jgi:putative flippase GtrA
MKDKIKKIVNYETMLYIFFGILTTAVNFIVYTICTNYLGIHYLGSNTLAFILAVIFAFITNKIFVFKSHDYKFKVLMFEFISFLGARIVSFGMDTLIMFVFVDLFMINDLIVKILSNVLVVILNYFFSKFIVFKKKEVNV